MKQQHLAMIGLLGCSQHDNVQSTCQARAIEFDLLSACEGGSGEKNLHSLPNVLTIDKSMVDVRGISAMIVVVGLNGFG